MTILVALSGGLDSTWVLQHLLRTKRDPIAVFHCNLINPYQRHILEENASDSIVEWCSESIRPVKWYKKTTVDMNGIYHGTESPILSGQIIGSLEQDYSCFTIAIGVAISENPSKNPMTMSRNSHGFDKLLPLMWHWTCVRCPKGAPRGGKELEVIYPCMEPHITKRFMRDDMDPELYALTWSCTWPKKTSWPDPDIEDVYEQCGRCSNCVHRGDIRDREGNLTLNGPPLNERIKAGEDFSHLSPLRFTDIEERDNDKETQEALRYDSSRQAQ